MAASLGLLLLAATEARAAVLAPGSSVAGRTIGEWTGDWWNWATIEGIATNPLFDTTGEFATLNQSGPVFHIAGSFGGTTVRSFDVPANVHLLIPLANVVLWAPDDGPDEAAIRAGVNAIADTFTSLFFELDGVSLADPFAHREESPAFTLFDGQLLADLGIPPGDRFPAVSDGYWVMLSPLSPGQHTLRFGGGDGVSFAVDTTAIINVQEVPEPSSLTIFAALGAIGWFAARRRKSGASNG
jgi:hypothetical protein